MPGTGQPEGLKVLFVDDEEALQETIRLELPRDGHTVTVCPDGPTAIEAARKNQFDCMIVDLRMPGMDGTEVIRRIKEFSPETAAIVLTGYGSFESAVTAMRYGACNYLTKPCRLEDLRQELRAVQQRRAAVRRVHANRRRRVANGAPVQMIGECPNMQSLRKLIAKVAPTDSTVLIRGETGTGKELVARSLHQQSHRADKPFVAINCGALPENLIESELFGHKKGAFTGADVDRQGLFAAASGGTLFLDEIGELPLGMQAKLLRVLESGEIRPVGDNRAISVDVRFVCATHRDIEKMVQEGQFREDLMFRINTFEVYVPPLRDRVQDVPLLAEYFLRQLRDDVTEGAELFSPEVLEELQQHVWPGNVRELANVIEHACILCEQLPIQKEHLPRQFTDRKLRKELRSLGPMSLKEMELAAIMEAIERHQGNKQAAAAELGISLKTLYNKINQANANKAA